MTGTTRALPERRSPAGRSHPLTLMVVHAHPDDEVFSTGGTLAACAERGIRTVVVYCTGGEGGELHGDLEPGDRKRLEAILRDEVRRSCDELGVDHVKANRVTVNAFQLAQRMPWGPGRLYYIAPNPEGFRRTVGALLPEQRTEEVVTEVARSSNLDPDSVDPGAPIDLASRRKQRGLTRIDVRRFALRKKLALAHHRSQIPPDYFYLQIPDRLRSEIGTEETFLRVVPPASTEDTWDLFSNEGMQESAA